MHGMRSSLRTSGGFTLLEVLVALAIIGLGMLAVFGQLNQSVTAAGRLRDKTIADWIAVDRVTELRLSGQVPADGTSSDDLETVYAKWHYSVKVSTPSSQLPNLKRVDVTVAFADKPDRPVATVVGFLLRRPDAKAPAATGGWEPISADAQTGQVAGAKP